MGLKFFMPHKSDMHIKWHALCIMWGDGIVVSYLLPSLIPLNPFYSFTLAGAAGWPLGQFQGCMRWYWRRLCWQWLVRWWGGQMEEEEEEEEEVVVVVVVRWLHEVIVGGLYPLMWVLSLLSSFVLLLVHHHPCCSLLLSPMCFLARGHCVEDIQVRLILLLHIHLIFFPFWDYIPYMEVHYIWGTKIVWHLIFTYTKLRCEFI